jgi:hypothetical protein
MKQNPKALSNPSLEIPNIPLALAEVIFLTLALQLAINKRPGFDVHIVITCPFAFAMGHHLLVHLRCERIQCQNEIETKSEFFRNLVGIAKLMELSAKNSHEESVLIVLIVLMMDLSRVKPAVPCKVALSVLAKVHVFSNEGVEFGGKTKQLPAIFRIFLIANRSHS